MRGKGLSYICYSFEINLSFFQKLKLFSFSKMQKKFKALGRFLGNKAFQSKATLAVKGPFFVPTIMIMFLKDQIVICI